MKGDYISREDLIERIRGTGYTDAIKENLIYMVLHTPAADVRLVRWIPTSERLPEEYRSVLVCFMSQGGMAQSVSERIDGNRWSALCGFEPVAWMPLPEPPNCGVNLRKDKQE